LAENYDIVALVLKYEIFIERIGNMS